MGAQSGHPHVGMFEREIGNGLIKKTSNIAGRPPTTCRRSTMFRQCILHTLAISDPLSQPQAWEGERALGGLISRR